MPCGRPRGPSRSATTTPILAARSPWASANPPGPAPITITRSRLTRVIHRLMKFIAREVTDRLAALLDAPVEDLVARLGPVAQQCLGDGSASSGGTAPMAPG